MRRKIQNTMIAVILITLAISYVIMIMAVYRQTLAVVRDELSQEAAYIRTAIENAGDSYLQAMDNVRKSTLITLVTPSGEVLYDSVNKEIVTIDISSRPELSSALEMEEGQDYRENRPDGWFFYHASLMDNGNILCVYKSVSSVKEMMLQILPVMLLTAALLLLLAYMLSKWQARKLVEPINEIDPSRPLENDVYEELTPLLSSIDRQNKEKDAIANMRKEFSANVSHELRTPLTTISGYAEIMKEGLVKESDVPSFASLIYSESQHLIRLIEDTIQLSKLDEGQITQEKEQVELQALVRKVCARLSSFAASNDVSIHVQGSKVCIQGIVHVLDEMIFNLCENAIKYNQKGGSVFISTGKKGDKAILIVKDTGIGIAEEEQERIFERFYRVEKSHSHTNEVGGSGLGLSIVKHAALVHGAEITLKSTIGKGTIITVLFS